MSTTIGVELSAHPFFLATLCATIQIAARKASSCCHGFSKAGQRNVIKHDRV